MYNKIVPSAEAKEESEARRHLNRSGDAAKDAGDDIKTSAYELKEAVKDSARGYGNNLQERQVMPFSIACTPQQRVPEALLQPSPYCTYCSHTACTAQSPCHHHCVHLSCVVMVCPPMRQ